MKPNRHEPRRLAVTLLELLVVVLIIAILATIATNVYTGQTRRAKIAAAVDLLHTLEVGITSYEVDTGTLPPSGSGDFPLSPLNTGTGTNRTDGSGFLSMVLVHSSSANANAPSSALWKGPYAQFQADQLRGPLIGGVTLTNPGRLDILDPWGSPVIYVQNADYGIHTISFKGGTNLFSGTAPAGANPNLPAPNPYVTRGETYYNTRSYILISFGPDSVTLGSGALSTFGINYQGAGLDDITNFGN